MIDETIHHRYTNEEIQALTPETVQALPDALLAGILKRACRSFTAQDPGNVQVLPLVLAEARRRGPRRIWCWWTVQQLDPDRCACGGPGHYIVGATTYCGKCRYKAVAKLQHVNRTLKEPPARVVSGDRDDYDQRRRLAEAAHRRHAATRGRRK